MAGPETMKSSTNTRSYPRCLQINATKIKVLNGTNRIWQLLVFVRLSQRSRNDELGQLKGKKANNLGQSSNLIPD